MVMVCRLYLRPVLSKCSKIPKMRSGIIFCAVFLQPDPLIMRRGFRELAIFGPEGDPVILVYIESFGRITGSR